MVGRSVDKDLVLAKVASIDRCLTRIEEVTGGDPQRLSDLNVADVFTLNVQRAAQAAIDLASHLVAARGLGLPTSLKDTFVLLERGAALQPSLSAALQKMVGFRNIAVHDYQALDPEILKAILTRHLDDFRAFAAYALRSSAP